MFFSGKDQFEQKQVRQHRIDCLLNIAGCNLKSQSYSLVLPPVNEALVMEPNNCLGLLRRAKATYLPINSSVEDYKAAKKDLQKLVKLDYRVQRVETLIEHLDK